MTNNRHLRCQAIEKPTPPDGLVTLLTPSPTQGCLTPLIHRFLAYILCVNLTSILVRHAQWTLQHHGVFQMQGFERIQNATDRLLAKVQTQAREPVARLGAENASIPAGTRVGSLAARRATPGRPDLDPIKQS